MLIRSTGGGCPLCGAAHTTCGQPTTVTPVDIPTRKETTVGPVRKYRVTHNGYQTILRLNDADVELYPGAELVDEPTGDADNPPPAKGRRAPNKSRTAQNKAE